jgi:hypothetical protein
MLILKGRHGPMESPAFATDGMTAAGGSSSRIAPWDVDAG